MRRHILITHAHHGLLYLLRVRRATDWRAARSSDPLTGRRPRESESALPPLHATLRTERSPISLFTPLLVQEPCAPYHTISVTVLGRGKVLQGKIASPTERDVDMRTVEPYPNITSGSET